MCTVCGVYAVYTAPKSNLTKYIYIYFGGTYIHVHLPDDRRNTHTEDSTVSSQSPPWQLPTLRAQIDFINKDTDGEQQHAVQWGKKERKKKKR